MLPRVVFVALLLLACVPSPWASPPVALALGVAFGLSLPHPYSARSRSVAKTLLQASVVGLGFGMDLEEVMRAGRTGFLYTLVGLSFALVVGTLLGRTLGVPRKTAYLISVGTAICGGSAIAAIGPTVDASDDEMSVSVGTVFILNAVGLVAFPMLGHTFGLTERKFGLWAALAIHDTSSVVGAGAKYGPIALMIATTVKLARALWIVPLTVVTAGIRVRYGADAGTKKKPVAWPWFIMFFLGAAVMSTYVGVFAPVYPWLSKAGRLGLTVTLFLIGTGMSRASLKKVGMRPLIQGVVLWVIVAAMSLGMIESGWASMG